MGVQLMVSVSFWISEQVLGGSFGFVGGYFWVRRWFRRFSCWRPLCYQVVSPRDSKWFPPKSDSESPMKPASGKLAPIGVAACGCFVSAICRSSVAILACMWPEQLGTAICPIGSWLLPLAISDPSLVHFFGPGPRKWSFTTIRSYDYIMGHTKEHIGPLWRQNHVDWPVPQANAIQNYRCCIIAKWGEKNNALLGWCNLSAASCWFLWWNHSITSPRIW